MTLRELLWMAEARRRDAWDHTASLLALTYNANRGKNQRARKPNDFHPLPTPREDRESIPKTKDLSILKDVFVKD